GSGPGGYVAAIKAAKLGKKTALIESREIGGTCLNRGCIPTKTLMHSSHLYYEAQSFQEAGIHFDGLSFDIDRIQDRKDEVISKIRQGIVSLLQANGVEILYGTATIQGEHRIILKHLEETGNLESELPREFETDKILIATGSKPVIPNIEGAKFKNVITSDELLSMRGKPYQKLLIIGGGVIGVEFATIYRELGCEVEIIEAMDRILPNMDKEISQSIAMSLKKKGVIIHTKSSVMKISEAEQNELCCEYEEKDSSKSTFADGILMSVGRRSNTENLFASGITALMEGASLKVSTEFETSIPGIYAIGDVIKGRQLAHAASAQGVVAVENMFGKEPSIDLSVIPSCIYTQPEVAVVGMSEDEASELGYTVKVGKYPMLGNSKTILSMGERGFIKVICDASTDRILGAQLLCDRATDMISEFSSAIVHGMTTHDLAKVIHPHPTYSEAITEAVEDISGMAIHLMPKKRSV
ncbi:MAG: dihydrolipoyl dehydrogenase, partial [Mobilitalea sp.]